MKQIILITLSLILISCTRYVSPPPGKFVELIMAIVFEKNIAGRVIIQSFNIRSLQYLDKIYPDIKTSLLVGVSDVGTSGQQVKDIGFTPTIYSPEYLLATQDLIKEYHDEGIKIIFRTINDKSLMKTLVKMGVDGTISDHQNLFNVHWPLKQSYKIYI